MMKTGIFISYRRGYTSAYAGRLAADLSLAFGDGTIYHDVDSIAPGEDYFDSIENALENCEVQIALVGPDWIDAKDKIGRVRLEMPEDLVAHEIVIAL